MPAAFQSLDKRFTLIEAERRFKKACDQIVVLNQRASDVHKRYKNAKKKKNRAIQYDLKQKLDTLKGVMSMYREYAHMKADLVEELRRQLYPETAGIVSG